MYDMREIVMILVQLCSMLEVLKISAKNKPQQ